jgi:hypothetical protein
MATLDIKLYDIPDKSKVFTISIFIQWNDAPDRAATNRPHSNRKVQGQHCLVSRTSARKESCQTRKAEPSQHNDRLLPTDKLVLNALQARVPQDEVLTPPVRLRELMKECSISRRQAQICLKRLGEKGMVSRITKGITVGSQEGYRYRILRGSRKAISKGE